MDIADIQILDEEKLQRKHDVHSYEAEEVSLGDSKFYFAEKGFIEGEAVYRALGRTEEGPYLIVFFIYKRDPTAVVISARDMSQKERNRYGKK